VFVDVDESALIEESSLGAGLDVARQAGLRPRAVIAVDMYGHPAPYSVLAEMLRDSDCILIADAAQSLGAASEEGPVGSLAPMTATSFFPAKPLGCFGDGGAVFVGDEPVARRLRSLRAHGKGDHKYEIERVGINGRLDTLQAAVLLEKLRIFDEEIATRQRCAARYDAAIDPSVRLPSAPTVSHAYAQYVIAVPERDSVAAALGEQGVPTAIHYPRPLHHQPAYRQAPRVADLSMSESLASRVLSLPLHPYLDDPDIEAVLAGLRHAGVPVHP
jgi:dTDP-4-amino-4,6-dideoxygalactose transaminase